MESLFTNVSLQQGAPASGSPAKFPASNVAPGGVPGAAPASIPTIPSVRHMAPGE